MRQVKNYESPARELVAQMTLEEKASLCSGQNFWQLKSIDRLGLKSIMFTDGPHGVRKQGGSSDHLGLNESIKATCFPTASATACSFDEELLQRIGDALGKECVANDVAVLLGPGVNIKRNPLCGRNFEYISEDPYLSGTLASSIISGIQSNNVGVSVKHYLANSQEKARTSSDSIVDERTLREIYLPSFEMAVKEQQPATLMCSYNLIDGTYASDNKRFMKDILRDEWGFEGALVTDWGAMNDRVKAISAGLDLEMPSSQGETDQYIVDAVKNNTLKESELDDCAIRITSMILCFSKNETLPADLNKSNELARIASRESAVLMKNDGILPLRKTAKVLVVGGFAKNPRYQGSGSSKIHPNKITSLVNELEKNNIAFEYIDGYDINCDEPQLAQIGAVVSQSQNFDVVICAVGLPDTYESEGFDRTHLNMPKSHDLLVEKLCSAHKNVVALLHVGSPVLIPYKNEVNAILNMYLGGQNVGGASFDLLFGDYSPCGKLAETYPNSYEDTPNAKWYTKENKIIAYKESVFVGYRYFDKAEKDVAFPFGFGKTYTEFKYSNLQIDELTKKVNVDITNCGNYVAKEIVQLYISAPQSAIYKAKRELKGFKKVELQPSETKTLSFELNERCFSFYNVNICDWQVESGTYAVEIGASSRDIRLCKNINVKGDDSAKVPDYSATSPSYYNVAATFENLADTEFEAVLGKKIPKIKPLRPFTLSSTLEDSLSTKAGQALYAMIKSKISSTFKDQPDVFALFDAMIIDMPLRNLPMLTMGLLNQSKINQLVEQMNAESPLV